jgi:thiol-disulfide isomerase/thioredoxin
MSIDRSGETAVRRSGDESHFAFFHAPWCGVCHEKSSVVDDLAKEHGLALERFDIEDADGRAEYERRGIKQIPTFALVRGERMPFRLVGAMITPENVAHLMRMHGRTD